MTDEPVRFPTTAEFKVKSIYWNMMALSALMRPVVDLPGPAWHPSLYLLALAGFRSGPAVAMG